MTSFFLLSIKIMNQAKLQSKPSRKKEELCLIQQRRNIPALMS